MSPKKKRKVEASIEKKKSFAKGMGVKSTLVSGSKVYMTTFAEGSDARLEKIVEGDSIRSVNEGEAFSAEMADKNAGYKIGNAKFSHPKGYAVVANNPLYTGPVQQDMLGLKETLEKRYFGESADGNDNICIQVIHNILDIEKILAEYITNAAYAVNNISGLDKDIIGFGKFSTVYTYDEFKDPEHHRAAFNNNDKLINAIKAQYDEFDNFLDNPRLGYFGQAFFSKEGRNYIINYGNECYDILALLSGLRHWVVHNNEEESRISRTWLYNLDKNLDNEYISTLNYLYDRITNELTNSFSKNSAANVNYIAETLGINPAEFAEQYFRFSIMKEQKNLGFNITKLREVMLDRKDMSEIRKNHKVFDSIRTKVYTMMDFVIYRYYIEEDAKVAAANKSLPDNEKSLSEKDIFVINLRGSFNDDQKDALYYDEANRIWRKLENIMHNIKEFRGNKTREYKKKDAPRLPRILPAGRDVSAFSKLMYALTMFLDGKEINDLLTTLINKFDNIQSFLKVMPLIGVNAKFVEEYAFFKDSAKIADELRLIKSFARMGEPIADARRAMYIDAIRILGTNLSYDELKALADTFSLDENGNKLKKGKHGMRNFIINNVISNKRFHYLIRYGDPAHLHEIAKNEAVVKFVLGRIADIQKKQGQNGKNQIDRYYETCIGKDKGKSVSEKVDALTKIITGMNYDQFDKKRSVIEDTGRENAEREKFKKIISLYLTVIYHILKNIVNINARYVIGFHCVERDAQLYKEKGYDINLKKLEEKGFSSVTKLCAGIDETAPDKRKDVEKEMAERAKESIDSLESANPKLYANYIKYSDEKKAEEFTRQINREKAKTALNAYLRNTKWNVIIREDLLRIDNKTCTLFRNKAVHLEVARYVHAYINDIAEVNSYFQLYHYIMQRIIMNERYEKSSGKVSEYFDAVNDEKKYNDRLLKLLCVPFGYCIPRFKNLSIEALFDRNEAAKFDKEKKKVSGNSGSGPKKKRKVAAAYPYDVPDYAKLGSGATNFSLLKQAGDVEENPGPAGMVSKGEEDNMAIIKEFMRFKVHMEGSVNGHEFEIEGEGEGRPYEGTQTAKLKVTKGGPLPFAWDILSPQFMYGSKAYVKHPADIPDYLKLSFPEGFKWERVMNFEDGGVVTVTQDSSLQDGEFIYKVKLRGTNFPSDGPVMQKKTMGWEASSERMYPEDGALKGEIKQRLKLKDGGHYDAEVKTTYKAKKPVQLPGAYNVNIKLDITSHNEDYTIVEQYERAEGRHSTGGMDELYK